MTCRVFGALEFVFKELFKHSNYQETMNYAINTRYREDIRPAFYSYVDMRELRGSSVEKR